MRTFLKFFIFYLFSIPFWSVNANSITAGLYHTCAISNENVYCWGANNFNQVNPRKIWQSECVIPGNSEKYSCVRKPALVQGLPRGKVTSVDAKLNQTCAVVDGGAWCWGISNYEMPFSDKPQVGGSAPYPIKGLESGVTLIASGYSFNCVVQNNKIRCWPIRGIKPGLYSFLTTQPSLEEFSIFDVKGLPPSSKIKELSVAHNRGCAILDNQSLWCWNFQQGPEEVFNAKIVSGAESKVTSVSTIFFSIAGIVDGKIKNHNSIGFPGEIFDPSIFSKPQITLSINENVQENVEFKKIRINQSGGCAISYDGFLWCWGNNRFGQLGVGRTATPDPNYPFSPDKLEPLTKVLNLGTEGGVQDFASGEIHICAKEDDRIFCWGGNGLGQLGDGSNEDNNMPEIEILDFVE